jgi:hypothetical protein
MHNHHHDNGIASHEINRTVSHGLSEPSAPDFSTLSGEENWQSQRRSVSDFLSEDSFSNPTS